jgi:phosphoribosylanthranilate isomerase
MTAVKICGIKTVEFALATAGSGADIIGLVFAGSPRQVTPAVAGKIVAALEKNRLPVKTAGVFVNMPAQIVNKIADSCRLDWVQLSGDETWEYCRNIAYPIIKAVRLNRNSKAEAVIKNLERGAQVLAGQKYTFLLDSGAGDKYGGTGTAFDWTLAKPAAERFPVIIAGGLDPQNVNQVIRLIKPWGVDVSTGVETEGVKDMNKIVEFIETVRQADARQA